MEILLDVIKVEPQKDNMLLLVFENNEKRLFDMNPSKKRPTVGVTLGFLERDMLEGTIIVLPSIDTWVYPHIQRASRQNKIALKGTTLVSVELISEEIGRDLLSLIN